MVLIISADAMPALSNDGLYRCGGNAPLWVFVIQNPARFPDGKPETRLDSGQRLQTVLFLALDTMGATGFVESRVRHY